MSSSSLILYDIPSVSPENGWSPNVWKARYALNFKGVPYKTVWVEYPDIAELYKKHGATASVEQDGAPHYTLPLLHDPATGRYVSESTEIAKYLEATYPDTPRLFPHGTDALIMAFCAAVQPTRARLFPFCIPKTCTILTPRSAEYFRRTREVIFGMKLEELLPQGEDSVKKWAGFKAGLGEVDSWMRKGHNFVMKDTISYADMFVASFLVWIRIIFGKESQEWKDVTSWHDGRWGALMKKMEQYERVI